MYVLMDMEWITNRQGHHCPTQLAAMRVDEEWNAVDTFSTLFQPRDSSFMLWDHIAYHGWTAADFRSADKLYPALDAFVHWLHPDDVLCWWHTESNEMFNLFVKLTGVRDVASKVIFLGEYVFGYLAGQKTSVGNPYKLCTARNIPVPTPMHCAENDVVAMQSLLMGIDFQQQYLKQPPKRWSKEATALKGSPAAPLLYDLETNTIHRSDCDCLEDEKYYPAFHSFANPIRRHHKPCTCCRDDFYDALWDRNQDTVARSEYNYVYSLKSKVFHSKECSHYLLAYDIQGTVSYEACIRKGLRPCKHCHPTPVEKKPKLLVAQRKVPVKKPSKDAQMSLAERKAIGRFRSAKEERENAMKRNDLTPAERDRVMALTQPGMAFWAARGYSTFHRRNCSHLTGLNQLKGFARFQDAIHAGYQPCRHCKPSNKLDVQFSIPITSKERSWDNCDTLVTLSTQHCLPYQYDDRYFMLETMAGKWKIDMSLRPVRLEHINLIKNHGNTTKYHTQPRLFLSLKDTFDYIMRHDKSLIEELQQSSQEKEALALG